MGTFKQLQHKSFFTSTPANPSQSFLRPSRSFSPLHTSAAQNIPLQAQEQLDHGSRIGHSLARIALLPPDKGPIDTQSAEIQRKIDIASSPLEAISQDKAEIKQAAQEGVQTPPTTLPFLERIRQSFGQHEVSRIQAHLGPQATASARAMHAAAYTTRNHVVFADRPNLHTVAHEAAHIVQQQSGIHLTSGIGEVGDRYEQHADAVANQVTAGQLAEKLLDRFARRPNETQRTLVHPGGEVSSLQPERQVVATSSAIPVQRYIRIGKDKKQYTRQDIKQSVYANEIQNAKGKAAIEKLINDTDVTFIFKDEKTFRNYLANPHEDHYTMEMNYDPGGSGKKGVKGGGKNCVPQALGKVVTSKTGRQWHDFLLASKINYTENDQVRKAVQAAGCKLVTGVQPGKIEEVREGLDKAKSYIYIGGGQSESHTWYSIKGGPVEDVQGQTSKGVQVTAVYEAPGEQEQSKPKPQEKNKPQKGKSQTK